MLKKTWSLLVVMSLVLGCSGSVLACYGAAALGMGGAYTAVADGVLAIYWNQAGLAFTEADYEFSATYSSPQNRINYNSFTGGMSRVNDQLTIGYGVTTLGYGLQDWYTLAFGYKIDESLAIGGAYRQVNSSLVLDDVGTGAMGFVDKQTTGLDLSAQYRVDNLRFGFLFQDVNGESDDNPYIKNFRPSVAYVTDKFTVAFDIYAANNKNYRDYLLGGEYYVDENWTVRGGIYKDTTMFGCGYKCAGYFADVVFIPDWDVTQLTIGVRF